MNRIDELFARKKKDVLAVYFTAGFPRLKDTVPVLQALQDGGADLVEIGMPFSDPLADGPVIQESSKQALDNGMSIRLLFEQLKKVREKITVPLVLMGYLNPVLQFGMEPFLVKCASCGIDGVILPDLPAEVYEREYRFLFEKYKVYPVFLATPSTPEKRIRQLASCSKGFLYLVSAASTTGSGKSFSEEQRNALKKVMSLDLPLPVLTGFGIHDAASRKAATEFSNGAVVGTAFIRELKDHSPVKATERLMNCLKETSYDHSVV